MFDLPKQQVKLIKVSTPMENHGKEYQLACVLTVDALLPSKALNQFSPGLCDALYRIANDEDGADLATDRDAPSVRRHPKMSPFDIDWTGTGYSALVDYGLGGDSDIKLIDAKLDSFTLSPLEGGSVSARFNIVVHPTTLDVGRLCEMQKQNIDLTLTSPEPTTLTELFDKGADPAPAKAAKGKKSKDENLADAQEILVAGAKQEPAKDANAKPKAKIVPAEAWPFPTKAA